MNKKFALKINKIKKSFGQKKILDEISFSLFFGEKTALIGANGSGKSTLAKIIVGEIKANKGSVEIFKNFSVSYLPQEMNADFTVEEYLGKNSEVFSRLISFGFCDGDEGAGRILRSKIRHLSGGEKTKIFLLKISLEKSPIIILDEPTNNLDTEGLEKLEEIIKNSKSAFLIISHDRAFLDKTVSKIFYLDEFSHKIKVYDGNYSFFSEKRKREIKREEMLWVENQKQKKKLELEILRKTQKAERKLNRSKLQKDNNKMSASAHFNALQNSAGKNKKRAETKLENFEEKEKPKYKRPLKIDFSEMKKSGNKVLEIKDLVLPYGSLAKISLEIFAGDRIQILGKNGSGKTTFIKEILKFYSNILKNNRIKWGVNIEIGYLPQVLEFGKNDESFLEYFLRKSGKSITDGRKILARFGFTDCEVETKISKLSPGMRSRGKIALLLANNPNFLILDEPTNNLDLEVLEEFEKALKNYKGTIIFISHDKYFSGKINPNKKIVL